MGVVDSSRSTAALLEATLSLQFPQTGSEGLCWRAEVQTFSRSAVELPGNVSQMAVANIHQVCFTGQKAAKRPVGVFDDALLPERARITKPSGSHKLWWSLRHPVNSVPRSKVDL